MNQNEAAARGPLVIALLFVSGLMLSSTALAERFSIVVLPDTQFYPEINPSIFYAQTEWIRNNRATENIIYASHLGDIINGDCTSNVTEWRVADTAMETLDREGVPYGILPGNHDWDPAPPDGRICPPANRGRYNGTEPGYENFGFGPVRFDPLGLNYGNWDGATNDNNYVLFEFRGIRFIAINFAYISESGAPSVEILDWADNLLATNPDRKAIITSHFILEENTAANRTDGQTGFSRLGRTVFDRLKSRANLFLMLGGHRRGEAWRIEQRVGMDDVHILLSNYQDYAYTPTPNYNSVAQNTCPSGGPGCGDLGLMRILRFDTDINQVSVTTFAPNVDDLNRSMLQSNRSVDRANRGTTDLNRSTASNFSFEFNAIRIPAPPSNLMIN